MYNRVLSLQQCDSMLNLGPYAFIETAHIEKDALADSLSYCPTISQEPKTDLSLDKNLKNQRLHFYIDSFDEDIETETEIPH